MAHESALLGESLADCSPQASRAVMVARLPQGPYHCSRCRSSRGRDQPIQAGVKRPRIALRRNVVETVMESRSAAGSEDLFDVETGLSQIGNDRHAIDQLFSATYEEL